MRLDKTIVDRRTKAERLFDRSVLPLLRDLIEVIAETGHMTVSLYIEGERVAFQSGTSGINLPCHEEASRRLPLSCLPAESHDATLGDRVRMFVDRGAEPPKGAISECGAGYFVYRNAVWLPKLGVISVIGCSQTHLSFKSPGVRLLRQLVRLTLDLCHVAVEWHYLSETLVHELVLILLACTSSAERLQMIGRAESLTTESIAELLHLARHIGTEAHMGVHEFDNVLRHLSSASASAGDKNLGLAGIRKPRRITLDIERELRESVKRFEERAKMKEVEFRYEVRLDQRVIVLADAYEVRRLFYNILSNAVKYSYHSIAGRGSKSGAERRFVRIFATDPDSADGTTTALCFENYGLGLIPGEEKLIHLPGYRGILAERESRTGSGIGLSEVQKIMNSLGGKISISSWPLGAGAQEEVPHLFRVKLVFPVSTRRVA